MPRSLLLLLIVVGLASCGTGGGGERDDGPQGGATLKVYVTDAPFPSSYVDSASIVVIEARARNAETGGWVSLFEGSREIDLVPLTGGVSEMLAEIAVPPGSYDEVRLVVDAGTVVLNSAAHVEGESHEFTVANGGLHVPSGASSGIKVKLDTPILVVGGLSEDLTLDFDLARNFVFNGPIDHAPGVKRVLFTPVVRAVNTTTAGTLTFVVLSDEGTTEDTTDDMVPADATVSITDADGTEISAPTPGLDGTVKVALPEGTYDVAIEAPGHLPELLPDVSIDLGNVTNEGTIRLAYVGATLSGVVLSDLGTMDTTDDVGLSGALVSLSPTDDPTAEPFETTTGASGDWQLDDPLPGTYRLTISAETHAAYELEEDVVLEAGEASALDDVTLTMTTP